MSGMEGRMKGDDAYKETSCFQTGLWEDMREPNMCADMPKGGCLVEPFEEEGVCTVLPLRLEGAVGVAAALFALVVIAPKADRAVDEEFLDRFVGMPFTSLSYSSVGSRLMNSFCSNWTTT